MKIIQGILTNYFKCFGQPYCFSSLGHKLFLRNFPIHSNLSNELSKTLLFKTEKLTPECLLNIFPEQDEKLLKIITEINCVIERKRRCPEFLKPAEFIELYALETKTQRLQYLTYLFKQEIVKEKDRLKKEEKKKQMRKSKSESSFNCDFSKYGLGSKTLLLNVRRRSINRFYNQRVANSVLFGNKIVIDLDYDKYMVEKEKKSCAAQLRHIIVANKIDQNPFDLHFCNANPDYKCVQYLKHDVPNIEESLSTICEKSYLDIFPKEHLIYLSPHATESLKTFDFNAIYIIGGFVDVVKKEKISTEKASIEGIRSYSLPLDDHIKWKAGTKSLTINQVFEIMLIFKNTGDWKKAFECIPIRKIQSTKSIEENQQTNSKILLTN